MCHLNIVDLSLIIFFFPFIPLSNPQNTLRSSLLLVKNRFLSCHFILCCFPFHYRWHVSSKCGRFIPNYPFFPSFLSLTSKIYYGPHCYWYFIFGLFSFYFCVFVIFLLVKVLFVFNLTLKFYIFLTGLKKLFNVDMQKMTCATSKKLSQQ